MSRTSVDRALERRRADDTLLGSRAVRNDLVGVDTPEQDVYAVVLQHPDGTLEMIALPKG